jgi:hypothetical protein
LPTALQIQNYDNAPKPYNHTTEDSIAHMDLDYWLEQIKATTVIVAHLAVPISTEK